MVRRSILLLIGTAVCLAGAAAWHKYTYPYGHRAFLLPFMHSALEDFAREHFGKYPASDKGPGEALRLLYPKYCSADELAGVSGDVNAMRKALREDGTITRPLTSWVYVQGLERGDDANLAVLWESKEGLFANGKRNSFGGHAVLLLGGTFTNVPAADWAGFLKQQEELRKAVQSSRTGSTNAPLQAGH
jgi:hypothetical protein